MEHMSITQQMPLLMACTDTRKQVRLSPMLTSLPLPGQQWPARHYWGQVLSLTKKEFGPGMKGTHNLVTLLSHLLLSKQLSILISSQAQPFHHPLHCHQKLLSLNILALVPVVVRG